MCRILLVKFKEPTQVQNILLRFAQMAEKSKALDGDWQGDGYGIAWFSDDQGWQVQKSLLPIWEDVENFSKIPLTSIFLAHARSASFPQHKDIIEFNQPYISSKYVFVFNGLLRGVSLPNVPGRIGAEKILYLLREELKQSEPQEALEKIKELLINSSKEIIALNIGLATKNNIYSINYFTRNPEYYMLHKWNEGNANIICSEKL